MGGCMPPTIPTCSPGAPDETLPPLGPTRLITQPGTPHRFNVQQEADARTALCRGMKEYIEQLSFDMLGRTVAFKQVFQTWADSEDIADYPSAAVNGSAPGKYNDTPKFSAELPNPTEGIPGTRDFIISACEYVLDMTLSVWATDNTERSALVAMLEQALNPVDWRYGLLLELPFYFNQRATYELLEGGYVDDEPDALRRRRLARYTIRGSVPVTRVEKLPRAKIRVNSTTSTAPISPHRTRVR